MNKDITTKNKPATSNETKRTGIWMRQPLTALGKIAFGTFLFSGVAGLGGTIALTIGNGAPSRDIVLTTICAFLCTILVVSGLRWLQMLAVLVGSYNLYLIFTEPFVIESLAQPKGPNGGYGHFLGDVLIVADSIVALVACIGIVLQNYNRISRTYPGCFTSVLGAVLGLVIGSCFIGALAQPSSSVAATLTYTNGVPTVHLSPSGFDLSSVTITKGSKLLLVDDTTEQHILANGTWQQNSPMQKQEPGAPPVNNLSLSGNNASVGPFTTAGTYHILCVIHRGMELTIIVQ